MSLADYLRAAVRRTPPLPEHGGLLIEGAGAPGANTSPFYLFYVDTVTDDTWFNPTRATDGWELALTGAQLETDEARLKVTI